MKLKFKKYIYLINDLSNALLKKEKDETRTMLKRSKTVIIALSTLLILSIALNVYLLLK